MGERRPRASTEPGRAEVYCLFAIREYNTSMQLKPQDLLVALKLSLAHDEAWTYGSLAVELGMSASEVHHAVGRATAAGLLFVDPRDASGGRNRLQHKANRKALVEFLVHGLRYVFMAERGGEVRGMPTSHAAPPLKSKIVQDGGAPPVWATPEGTVRGWAVAPLYRSAPFAAEKDPALYELLALVDALRIGQTRERALAAAEIEKRLAA